MRGRQSWSAHLARPPALGIHIDHDRSLRLEHLALIVFCRLDDLGNEHRRWAGTVSRAPARRSPPPRSVTRHGVLRTLMKLTSTFLDIATVG